MAELWTAFGIGNYFHFIGVHDIAASLSVDKSKALSIVYGHIGCDMSNSFGTVSKRKAWNT